MTTNYSNSDYWNKRYQDEEDAPYDWLFSYEDVREVFDFLLPDRNEKILMIGCGNAPFSPDMYHVGNYNKIVNIDLSSVVIEQQARKYPEQIWKVMNALNMDIDDESFPIIIDKSLIDTLLCASESKTKTVCMVKEAYRVLKPGGRFITFSLHDIDEVEPTYLTEGLNWKVSSFRIKSDRWNDTNNRRRSVAHTMLVCDKPTADGKYLHEHPLQIPRGVLSEEEYKQMKAVADEVNFKHAMQHAKYSFLSSALFHALHGESAIRNTKLKLLEDLCRSPLADGSSAEDASMTPVVDTQELLENAEYSLREYVREAEAFFLKEMRALAQAEHQHVTNACKDAAADNTGVAGAVGTTQDAQ